MHANISCYTVYAPNDNIPEFFKGTFALVEKFENQLRIIAGDMNLVMNLKLDKWETESSLQLHVQALQF